MYEIRNAGAKGLGVFASKWIARRTRIMAERPVFTVKSEQDVFAATRNLPPADRSHLMQLSVSSNQAPKVVDWLKAGWDVARGALSTPSEAKQSSNTGRLGMNTITEYMALLAVFRNNNFDIGNNIQAVFRDICRVNHSCVPNTQGNFNSAIGCFTVHALRPIEEEEQITVSYLELHGAVKAVRQALLHRGYGFECDCPACDTSSKRARDGERRRVSLRDKLTQYAETASKRDAPDYRSELEMLREVIQLFEQEGLSGRELATMYLAAAEGNVKIGNREEARRYSQIGLDMEEMCLGTDNPLYKESVQRMKSMPKS